MIAKCHGVTHKAGALSSSRTCRGKVLLSRRVAAEYLGLSEATLARWASVGSRGLNYYLVGGRACYDLYDLERFVESGRKGSA
jgi:hypothetical protein